MSDTVVELPPSLRAAVAWELRDALRPPYTLPSVVTFNALLMAGAWFLLPQSWQDWLFTLHGPLAFAMVHGRVDVLRRARHQRAGPRPRAGAGRARRPAMLRRLLYAKNLALWCFVAPFCTVVAVIIGYFTTTGRRPWSASPPSPWSRSATLGIAGWVGIVWPYHPRDCASDGSTAVSGST